MQNEFREGTIEVVDWVVRDWVVRRVVTQPRVCLHRQQNEMK